MRALKELREKDKPKGRRKKKAGVSERGPATLGNLSKPSCIIKDPPANYSYSYCQADGGGVQRRWREERIKPGALRVPERSSSCVSCIAGLVSEWSFFKDGLKITSVYSCRRRARHHTDRWRNIRADMQRKHACTHTGERTHLSVHKHTNGNLRTTKCTFCRLRCHLAKRSSTAGWKRRSQRECVLSGKWKKASLAVFLVFFFYFRGGLRE